MDAREIRGWLLRKPKPSWLRVIAGDGNVHEIEITPNVRYVELANTVASLLPEQMQALTDKKRLIRAIRPDEVQEQNDAVPRNASLEQDPENARLITFAQLVAEAYKDSREFTALAFDKLGELFQAVVRKSESQEKTISALDRMVQKLMLEKVAESAGVGEDGAPLTLDSLLQGMMQGKLQAEAARTLNGGENGAPKEGGKK